MAKRAIANRTVHTQNLNTKESQSVKSKSENSKTITVLGFRVTSNPLKIAFVDKMTFHMEGHIIL